MIHATPKHKNLIIQILCDSFDKNKSINYIVKQDQLRKQRIRILMEYSYNIAMKFGEVFISENHLSCALVLYPEKKKLSLNTIFSDLNLVFNCIGISRIGKVLEKEKKTKVCHPSILFTHLWFIGVSPKAQGKGIGQNLLHEIIAHSTKIGRPVYLETSMTENLKFYEKFGFEIYNTVDISYKIYFLRRFIV